MLLCIGTRVIDDQIRLQSNQALGKRRTVYSFLKGCIEGRRLESILWYGHGQMYVATSKNSEELGVYSFLKKK